MTSAVASIGISYGGTDCQESDLGVFLELVRGLNEPPSTRGEDTIVPGAAFRIPRSRVADTLTIELRGIVRGEGSTHAAQKSDYRDKMQALRTRFDTTAAPADLVATLEDSTTATISCRTANVVVTEIVQSLYASVSIELEAYEDWA